MADFFTHTGVRIAGLRDRGRVFQQLLHQFAVVLVEDVDGVVQPERAADVVSETDDQVGGVDVAFLKPQRNGRAVNGRGRAALQEAV